ncbi:unnamed protein product [Haemonchus placei]|uniref:Ras-related protein Rab-3 n=1 Tax=Haemonchus placei TaxID=6290 RepID=A0A158QP31_HAEPC|nr:unnamed protein product [Haemonchus placei]
MAAAGAQQPAQGDQNFDYMFKLLIIGNSSVGKTSFLFRYCDDSFTSAFVSTVGIDFKVKTVFRGDKRVKLQIWDTAGQERYRTITTAYYRGAMGFILMYDITNEESFNSVQDWCTQIKTYSWENAQVVLVGNKCDMDAERVVSIERGRQLADQLSLEFFETSAKENINVKAVFEKLVEIICDKMAESLDKNDAPQTQETSSKIHQEKDQKEKEEPAGWMAFYPKSLKTLVILALVFLMHIWAGSEFVYGFLSKPPPICQMKPVLVFSAFQVLVFFGSVVSLLYYYGIIQWVLKRMAYLMQLTLGTTAVESLNACACVFLGQSALLVRPYLEKQTSSELHAIMASGFSCIAGSLFAAYVSFGACPKYLLSSSVMSAPASLAFAKIIVPETEESQSRKVSDLDLPSSEEDNPIESISNGAIAGVHIVVAIAANLVAVLALLALVDSILFYFGDLLGYGPWSLENLLQYLMFPVAFVMGVIGDTQETLAVARLIATKTAVNEFVAYRNLGEMISDRSLQISPRSAMIATYALCSFSNLGTVGIVMGVLGGMVPSKRHILARMVFRALICGCVCCLYTAALAGVLVGEPLHCQPSSAATACFDTSKAVNSSLLQGL